MTQQPLCPEFEKRAAMSDEDFWAHIYRTEYGTWQDADGDEPPEIDPYPVEPCPVCGEQGACAYDTEGRPLIHTDLPDEFDHHPVGDPDEQRLGQRVVDVDTGGLL